MEKYEDKYLTIFKSGPYENLLQCADAKLLSEDGSTFDVHRVVLASKSDYFRSLFFSLINKNKCEFTIPGISGRCLTDILHYFYVGEITINAENIAELLLVANYMLIEKLCREIKDSYKEYLIIANCLKIFQVANQISDEKIARECLRFIEMRYEEIFRTQKSAILNICFETLKKILSSRSLRVYEELTVWKTIVEWTQRNASERLRYVPQLLMCLASKEINDNYLFDFCQHTIIKQNDNMKQLREIKTSTDSRNNVEIFSQFLEDDSSPFRVSNGYRVPLHLHVIRKRERIEDVNYKLFITYDENFDLWREIGVEIEESEFFEVVKDYLYVFNIPNRDCRKYDIIWKVWVPMKNYKKKYQHSVFIARINQQIYIIGWTADAWQVEVYDTLTDRWSDGIPPSEIDNRATFVVFDVNIYGLGHEPNSDEITLIVFNLSSQKWSRLSAPTKFDFESPSVLAFVACHKMLYLIGENCGEGNVVAVYMLETDTWMKLPNLPYRIHCLDAVVLADQVVMVCDQLYGEPDRNTKNFCWNEDSGDWENLEPTSTFRVFSNFRFAIVEDLNSIRAITRINRSQETVFEESPFK